VAFDVDLVAVTAGALTVVGVLVCLFDELTVVVVGAGLFVVVFVVVDELPPDLRDPPPLDEALLDPPPLDPPPLDPPPLDPPPLDEAPPPAPADPVPERRANLSAPR